MIRIKFLISLLVIISSAYAQGDGPRNLLWGPTGVTALIPKWMDLQQNMTPSNILITNANIKINVFPITLVHNFNLGDRFAQVMLNTVPGNLSGTIDIKPPTGFTTPVYTNSGFADGFIGFKLGLINAPALNVLEFAKYRQRFSMMLYTRFWYSGTYSADDPVNMGSNRFSMDVGFPMNIQLSSNPKRPTWLESYPAIHYYAANNNPPKINKAQKLKQLPLFSFENHLSHNFTDKFWAAVTLRYQYGGAVAIDNLIDPNSTINMLGTGVTVGYQVLPMFALQTGYGWVIVGENNAKANMFRLVAVISYANIKKLKQSEK
jgi:hypothetical protein